MCNINGHKWWTLSNKTNIYCGTGIPGSAFWWRSSKLYLNIYLNIYNAIPDFCWLHNMAGICMACFCVWALYSDYCMVCFFCKVFLKSHTAVALSRSISLILWITLVSYIKVYDEYFCKLMLLSAKSLDVLEANMKSYECHLMKIIKG